MILGNISGKYESNNKAEEISSGYGDLGGVSYGSHQFIAFVANAFAVWLHKVGYNSRLWVYGATTDEFNRVWLELCDKDYQGFLNKQHEYTKIMYYDRAVELLAQKHFNADKHSFAMQECIFSRAVHYGPGNVVELFEEGLKCLSPAYLNLSYVADKSFDERMIEAIYNFLIEECYNAYQLDSGLWHSPKDWANGSYDVVKIGLRNRFENEKNDLLELLKEVG